MARILLIFLSCNLLLSTIPRCRILFEARGHTEHCTQKDAAADHLQVIAADDSCRCALLTFMNALPTQIVDASQAIAPRPGTWYPILFPTLVLLSDFIPPVEPPYPKRFTWIEEKQSEHHEDDLAYETHTS